MKDDSGYFYSIEPVIDIDHFIELLFVCLAQNTYPYFSTSSKRIVSLPINYLAGIENILKEKEFGYYFADLIDLRFYYEHQLSFERKLKTILAAYLEKETTKWHYDILENQIQVEMDSEELATTLSFYDEKTREKMERFCRLLTAFGTKREDALERKENDRIVKRIYIRNGQNTFSKNWDD